MIILVNGIQLYSKKVITDLGCRSGPSNESCFSYGSGMSYVIDKYWKNLNDERLEYDVSEFLAMQKDFDADVVKPSLTSEEYSESAVAGEIILESYDPTKDAVDYKPYFRRLEDIAPEYIEKYLGNMVYNVTHNNNGLKSYKKTHREQATLFTGDADDEFVELAELLTIEKTQDWSMEAKQDALIHLPYVLKRLHNLSCYTGIHMLSFIMAFVKARDRNERLRNAGRTKTLKKNAVIQEGVYKCTKFGNVGAMITVDNRNQRAEFMFNWITQQVDDYKSYYEDYLNLMHYIDVFNIRIEDDDFTKYDSYFIDKLVVQVVTPNSQYDTKVYQAIQQNAVNAATTESVNMLEHTIEIFRQACAADQPLLDRIQTMTAMNYESVHKLGRELVMKYFLSQRSMLLEAGRFHWEYGFLYYGDEVAQVIPTFVSDEMFTVQSCIISELGYVIHVTDDFFVQYIDLVEACNYADCIVMNRVFQGRPPIWCLVRL